MNCMTRLMMLLMMGAAAGCASTHVAGERESVAIHDHDHSLSDSVASHDHMHVHQRGDAVCTCDQARQVNGWCGGCNVGYVASVRIESEMLFEAIDAHGHTIAIDRITCPSCRIALADDGYCDACRMGFVNQQAYFSPVSHALAKGTLVTIDAIECETCRSNASETGWCDACAIGMVGNIRFDRRAQYDAAVFRIETVVSAIERAESCELCAAAMVVNGRCPTCRIAYRGGVAVDSP